MLKQMILGFSLLVASVSFADDLKASTRFETLQSWYAQGTPVTYDQVNGNYAGRCFVTNDKNTPQNALLGMMEKSRDVDAGPGFPAAAPVRKTSIIFFSGHASNYFDDRTIEETQKDVNNVMTNGWNSQTEISESPTFSWFSDWEPNGKLDEKNEIVQYGSYLVLKQTALISQSTANPWISDSDSTLSSFQAKAGQTVEMCYFFKKF